VITTLVDLVKFGEVSGEINQVCSIQEMRLTLVQLLCVHSVLMYIHNYLSSLNGWQKRFVLEIHILLTLFSVFYFGANIAIGVLDRTQT
jgi:hypothetical protein